MNKEIKKLYRPTWAEIDLKAVRHNFRQLKRKAGKKTDILAVVKANAYGHGMVKVAKALISEGVSYFGVSSITEGISLRKVGIKKPILILGNISTNFIKDIVEYNLTVTIHTLKLAKALNSYGRRINKKINVHIQIDTGMGRLGIWQDEAIGLVRCIARLGYLRVEGIYTHFPVADIDRNFTQKQIKRFSGLIKELTHNGLVLLYTHVANSMGLVDYPNSTFNLARPGLMIYGLYPKLSLTSKIKLKPALSIKTRIVFVKEILKGRSVSYGRTFIAKNKRKIATLPIGYNDGYMRCFSNRSFVLVNGKRCPVVGRVTMDQIMVDVTKVKLAKEGMEVVILGYQKGVNVSADELAEKANTINYEIACNLGNRLPHVYRT